MGNVEINIHKYIHTAEKTDNFKKYLGVIINNKNYTSYKLDQYKYNLIMKARSISWNTKIKLYKTDRPVVLFAAENLSITNK